MPQYQILRMDIEETPPLLRGGIPMVWNNPAEAAADAKVYAQRMSEKLCVKPIVDEKWRQRENERMRKKDYRPLPWTHSTWWAESFTIWKDHYPHASLEKPGYIAYTKSEEDGVKDKQTIVRAGAYLSKYFERTLDNHGIVQQTLVNHFMTMYGPIDVKFATTEDDIVKVYNNGPQTCLHREKKWSTDIHPATVYAAGDLAIAYIGNLNGKVSGRVLCWPEKKIHSRVYGDVARLTQGLARLGYQYGPPLGAKLKRIPVNPAEYKNGRTPEGCFVAPYIDKKNQQGGGHLSVKDKDSHLVICMDNEPGSHHCSLAEGVTGNYVPREDEHPRYICDRCETEALEIFTVQTEAPNDDGDHEEEQQWCNNCRRQFSWQCRYSGNIYCVEVKHVIVDGVYWLPYYADMYAVRCEGNHKLYSSDNVFRVYLPDGTSKRFSREFTQQAFGGVFKSELTGRMFPVSEKSRIWIEPGVSQVCAKQELKHHAFQCDGCDNNWRLEFRYQPPHKDNLLCPLCATKFKETRDLKLSQRVENERAQIALPLQAAE